VDFFFIAGSAYENELALFCVNDWQLQALGTFYDCSPYFSYWQRFSVVARYGNAYKMLPQVRLNKRPLSPCLGNDY
jgi:hypothetical protein